MDSPDSSRPPREEARQRHWVFHPELVTYPQLLRLLFTHPKLALSLTAMGKFGLRKFWIGTLLALVLLIGAGAFLITANAAPDYAKDVRQGAEFLLATAGDVVWNGASIQWDLSRTPEPVSRQLPHVHFTLAPDWEQYQPPAGSAEGAYGLVMAPQGVGLWYAAATDEPTRKTMLLPAERFQSQEPLTLTQETQNDFCTMAFMGLSGGLFVYFAMDLARLVLTVVVALTVAWLFLSRGAGIQVLPRLLLRALNFALPPLAVTIIWTYAGLPGETSVHYTILCLVYILYYVIEGRSGTVLPVPKPPSKP